MASIELALPLVLVLTALAALRYGVDSRLGPPGEPPPPPRPVPTPAGDLAALLRAAREAVTTRAAQK